MRIIIAISALVALASASHDSYGKSVAPIRCRVRPAKTYGTPPPPPTYGYTQPPSPVTPPPSVVCGCPLNDGLRFCLDGKAFRSQCEALCGKPAGVKDRLVPIPPNVGDADAFCKKPVTPTCDADADEPVCLGNKYFKNDCVARNSNNEGVQRYFKLPKALTVPQREQACKVLFEPQTSCSCTKTLSPVCMEGKVFGNECEAKCSQKNPNSSALSIPQEVKENGLEAYCAANQAIISCSCLNTDEPVCMDGKLYENKCRAACGNQRFENRLISIPNALSGAEREATCKALVVPMNSA